MFIRQLLFITLMLSILTIGPIHGEYEFKASEHQDQADISTSELKDIVKNIQSKADVNSYLGTNYQEVRGEMYNNTVWRFDISPKPNYQFMAELDRIDIEGLQKGLVNYIVFISFGEEESTIISKSIYYCDHSENVREVKYIGNQEKENVIFSR
ncbi:MAG: hypothetical protein ABTA16_02680 [Niallia sp.]|nr:hypothetical protein [Yersinia enterocolitica]